MYTLVVNTKLSGIYEVSGTLISTRHIMEMLQRLTPREVDSLELWKSDELASHKKLERQDLSPVASIKYGGASWLKEIKGQGSD